MPILTRRLVLPIAATILSVFAFGMPPAWSQDRNGDETGTKPCNSLCRTWMAWGGVTIPAPDAATAGSAVDLHPDLRDQRETVSPANPQPAPEATPHGRPSGSPAVAVVHSGPVPRPIRDTRAAPLPPSRPRHVVAAAAPSIAPAAAHPPKQDAVRLVEAEMPLPESPPALTSFPVEASPPTPTLVQPAEPVGTPRPTQAAPAARAPAEVASAELSARIADSAAEALAAAAPPKRPTPDMAAFPPAFDVIAAVMLGGLQTKSTP